MPIAIFEPNLTFTILLWLLALAAPGLMFLLVAVAFALLGPRNNRTRRIVQCCAWLFVIYGSFSFLLITANLVCEPDEPPVWIQFGVVVLLYVVATWLLVRCRRQRRLETRTGMQYDLRQERRWCLRRITAAILLTGLFCAPSGTVRTRIAARKSYEVFQGHNTHLEQSPGAFFGKPPYQAVADDLESRPYSRPSAYIAIPFDFVWDTVFLPFDLIGWAFGCEKGWRGYRVIDMDFPNEFPTDKKVIDPKLAWQSRNDPVKRAEIISQLTTLLSDPSVRETNPLGIPDMLRGLSSLNAFEAESTLVSYMFFDKNRGSDFRLIEGDMDVLIGKRSQSMRVFYNRHVPTAGSLWCVTWAGTNFAPRIIERFSQATPEEMSMEVGGGAFPFLAYRYFAMLQRKGRHGGRFTPEECIQMVQSFIDSHSTLSLAQKTNLDKIIDVIRTRKWTNDNCLDSKDPSVRAWAPSFAMEPWPARTNYCDFNFLMRYGQATVLGYSGHDRSVIIPGEVGGLSVRNIAPHAFKEQPITDVVIPSSVTNIGEYAFVYCMQLTNIVLSSGLVSIGPRAFASCRGLKEVTLPETVKSIGAFAFSNCFDRRWAIYFKGEPPTIDPTAFFSSDIAIYYEAGSSNWPATFGDKPTHEMKRKTE